MDKLFLSERKIVQTFSTLLGLINGIQADRVIKDSEIKSLKRWIDSHYYLAKRAPFNEIIEIVDAAISDSILTADEIKDIQFVCNNFVQHYGEGESGQLFGLAAGIASDDELNEKEWTTLKKWLTQNSYLKNSWPYDEIECLVTKHSSAIKLSAEERTIIISYFKDFCGLNGAALSHPLNEPGKAITTICAICPEIEVEGKVFCVTGESRKYPRKEIADMIHDRKGYFKNGMSQLIDYLVICNQGSPMWIFNCYGRKIQMAISLRKSGHRIQIINELDLWDHFEDAA